MIEIRNRDDVQFSHTDEESEILQLNSTLYDVIVSMQEEIEGLKSKLAYARSLVRAGKEPRK